MKIAEKIYRLRTEHDMTQSQLAKIAGVSDKAVSAWEAGTRDPKIKSIQGICSHFGIDINCFIDEDTNDYREKAPTPEGERPITFDDFTYAMQNETKELTEMDKQILLSMAKQLNDARKQKNGETG